MAARTRGGGRTGAPAPGMTAWIAAARALVATIEGRDAAIAPRYREAKAHGLRDGELLEVARMAHLFGGFPRAIRGLERLAPLVAPGRAEAPRTRGADRRRGEALFRRIYGSASGKVIERLERGARGFASWVLEDAYGRVLARDGLDAAVRELLAVAALAALDCPEQLESHVRGALRLGVTPARLAALLDGVGRDLGGARRARARAAVARIAAARPPARTRS